MTRSYPLDRTSPSPADYGRQIAARWSPTPFATASALALGLATTPAFAVKTYTVNNFSDTPLSAGCTTADCTLREAIVAANTIATSPGPDIIKFKASTTAQTITTATGELQITDAVTITGPGAGMLTVDGNAADNVFYISTPTGHDVSISGLTITNGLATNGGGIRAIAADLFLNEVVVKGNTAGNFGGGVHSQAGSLSISNSTITGNQANNGGGVSVSYGSNAALHQFTMVNSTLSHNDAINMGAGIYLYSTSGPVVIDKTSFINNDLSDTAGTGGGIHIHKTNKGSVFIRNSTFTGNDSGSGAMADGGAIYVSEFQQRPLLIENSTITGNSAGGDGGGMALHKDLPDGLVRIRNSTITQNSAGDRGGGLASYNTYFLVQNSIIADNTATAAPDIENSAAATVFLQSSILKAAAGVVVNQTGDNFFNVDPDLHTLGAFGGPTLTKAELRGSIGLDTGSGAVCAESNANRDQRGVGRPFDGNADGAANCDIGAYEFNGNVVACPGSQQTSCDGIALKGSISVVNNPGTKTDSFKAALTSVSTPTTTFFGIPTSIIGTPAAVCLYANNGSLLVGSWNVPAGGVDAKGLPLWKLASTGQTSFTLPAGNIDGVSSLIMKPSTSVPATNGSATLLTKTGAVTVPYDVDAAQGTLLNGPVVLQFITNNNNDDCVTTTFSGAQITSNTPAKFTAVK